MLFIWILYTAENQKKKHGIAMQRDIILQKIIINATWSKEENIVHLDIKKNMM